MKIFLLALPGALATATKVAYGPSNCVSLDLSSEGTCVIKTNCPSEDLEKFEFAFDCTTPKHDVQRHSFGFGGFDAQEVFDTSVKCTICEPPTDQHHVLVGTGSTSKTVLSSNQDSAKDKASEGEKAKSKESKKAEAKKTKSESETKVVKYGPNECVSTYRNSAGHCIMQTNCAKENITDYEFGLICVDKTGEPVRHVFGKNSFDQEESFDTLIACDKCVGLDDIADETSLVKQVEALTTEVEDMNKTLSTLRTSVKKLKKEVGVGPAPAPAPEKAKGEFLLPKIGSSTKEEPVAAHRKGAKLHLKTTKKHSAHTRKIQRDEDEDSDDDQDQTKEEDEAQDEDEEDGQQQDEEQTDADDA